MTGGVAWEGFVVGDNRFFPITHYEASLGTSSRGQATVPTLHALADKEVSQPGRSPTPWLGGGFTIQMQTGLAGAEDMAQCLRAFAALTQDPGSVLSTLTVLYNHT